MTRYQRPVVKRVTKPTSKPKDEFGVFGKHFAVPKVVDPKKVGSIPLGDINQASECQDLHASTKQTFSLTSWNGKT